MHDFLLNVITLHAMQESAYYELKDEEIYLLPAKTEEHLYEQLHTMKTSDLDRRSIEYV
jgi:hypothetical protein